MQGKILHLSPSLSDIQYATVISFSLIIKPILLQTS